MLSRTSLSCLLGCEWNFYFSICQGKYASSWRIETCLLPPWYTLTVYQCPILYNLTSNSKGPGILAFSACSMISHRRLTTDFPSCYYIIKHIIYLLMHHQQCLQLRNKTPKLALYYTQVLQFAHKNNIQLKHLKLFHCSLWFEMSNLNSWIMHLTSHNWHDVAIGSGVMMLSFKQLKRH